MIPSLTIADALSALSKADGVFVRLIEKFTFDVNLYKPGGADPQQPLMRDELYVVATGTGDFYCDGRTQGFRPGDAFFVPGGVEHRFVGFSADFSAWVVFFGPRQSTRTPG